jgi:hypothetical protein
VNPVFAHGDPKAMLIFFFGIPAAILLISVIIVCIRTLIDRFR